MKEIPYYVPWITKEDKQFVLKALNQRWLTDGPLLKKFEQNVSRFIGSKYSVGVGSATHALHLAVRSLGIKNGDEVIVPTFTFAATANAVKYCGAKPILTDVDYETFNILPSAIEKNISKKTKAIIVVHYGGQSCDMSKILSIAKKHNLYLIEDCAHAFGTTYGKSKCGNIGNVGCFSFYPTKIITTGEGGMVTSNSLSIYQQTKLLRSQGMNKTANQREKEASWKYDIIELGYNYRLDEVRSALGISQLKRVNLINKKRIQIAKIYDKKIGKINGITIPYHKTNRNHIYHLYTIKIQKNYHLTRNEVFKKLTKNNIGASVQYYPLHLMTFYKKNSTKQTEKFQNANKLKDEVICLPIFPQMTQAQIDRVVSTLR